MLGPKHQTRVGFLGFLRAGVFTVPSFEGYDHLTLCDLVLDSHSEPTVASLQIKQSKTDPFRQGVDVFLGKTDTAICPVNAIHQHS